MYIRKIVEYNIGVYVSLLFFAGEYVLECQKSFWKFRFVTSAGLLWLMALPGTSLAVRYAKVEYRSVEAKIAGRYEQYRSRKLGIIFEKVLGLWAKTWKTALGHAKCLWKYCKGDVLGGRLTIFTCVWPLLFKLRHAASPIQNFGLGRLIRLISFWQWQFGKHLQDRLVFGTDLQYCSTVL